MQDFLKVTGMVIGSYPQGEYDRRVVLLTRECGKITAFVKGARRQGSRFMGTTDMFVFGSFELFVGKSSYNIQNAEILNYFEFLRNDITAAYYAMYFLELADYYALENNDESLLLLLVYRAIQGLKSPKLDNEFVRRIFELKLFVIEGEFIPIDRAGSFTDAVYGLIDYVSESSIEKLFNIQADSEMMTAISDIADYERKHLVDRRLNSLEMLDIMKI